MKLRKATLQALATLGVAAFVPMAWSAGGNASDGTDKFKSESMQQREQMSTYADDTWITTKVKAALVKEMKSANVSVETYHGQVLLSGFVDKESDRSKAMQVASSVQGVVRVKDGLVVKQ